MNKITNRYITNLHKNHLKIKYLLDRGLSMESIRRFGIGLALSSKEETVSLLENKQKYIRYGLLRKIDKKYKPFFSNRIMIPLKSIDGEKVVGFSGRDIFSIDGKYLSPKELSSREFLEKNNFYPPKYKNSMESDLFKKREYLYNIDSLPNSCTSVIMFESQLNAIACDQLQREEGVIFELDGVDVAPHPIAIGGTGLTGKHLDLLASIGISNITLCFDGDRAGIEATQRAIEMILGRNDFISVSVISMPINTDLMDLIKYQNRVKRLINKIRFGEQWLCDYFNYKKQSNNINSLSKEFEDVTGKFRNNFLTIFNKGDIFTKHLLRRISL